jgi:hypothetical protein
MFEDFWQIEVRGQIGTWLASVGTIAAVWVALWLAWTERSQYVRIRAGIWRLFSPGTAGPIAECLSIKAVNYGHKAVQINGLGWRSGWLKKRHGFQVGGTTPDLQVLGIPNPPIPITLAPGQEATWYVRLDGDAEWLPKFAGQFVSGRFARLRLLSVRVTAWSSTGRYFMARIDKSFRSKIREALPAKKKVTTTTE